MDIKGNGQIETAKNGQTYKVRFSLGKDPATGKYSRTEKRTFHGTKAEAREFALIWKQEFGSGLTINPHNLTVEQYAEAFHGQREAMGELFSLTLTRDNFEFRKIVELFGDIPLNELDTGTINKTYAKLHTDGGMSLSSVHKLHKKLSQLLKQAVAEQIIPYNPCDAIRLRTPKPAERKSFTLEEATKLAAILKAGDQTGRPWQSGSHWQLASAEEMLAP